MYNTSSNSMHSPLNPINSKNTTLKLPSPPPLQTYTLNVGNNESIENNKDNIEIPLLEKSYKSNTERAVPPLELLTEDQMDVVESEEKHIQNEEVMNQEVEESGDIIPETSEIEIHSNNNSNNNNNTQDNNNNNNNNNNNMNIRLSSTGRLLESDTQWELRPKVTFDNVNRMIFRPLRMKCTHCTEAFTKTHDLYAHIRTHQDHTKCPHCDKILTCMATFVYHVRTHSTEKPYYCPVIDCPFTNAVKYNLKVHLACIRHGGKDNLKKYAKVLDLDVCEKSLRKRKDNSVHELGSRRSRKKRKLNINKIKNNNYDKYNNNIKNEYNTNMNINNINNINEYDQFATQLLFSLSGMPPVFDHQINQLVDWNTIISPQNEINIKSENQININNENIIKHETQYYDPSLYGYYINPNINTNNNINTNMNTTTNTNTTSSSTCIWTTNEPTPQIKLENDTNTNNNINDSILLPKQEQITNNSYINTMNTVIPSYINDTHSYPINYFHYPQPYYLNYDNALLLYPNHQINHITDNNNNNNEQENSKNKKIDIPPLPIPFQNEQWTENSGLEKNF